MPSFAPVPTRRSRSLPSALASVAMHGALLALVFVAGKAAKDRVLDPTQQYQFIAMVENAGTGHASRFPLPPMDLNAQRRHPDPSPEVTHKTLIPVVNARPKVSGGGAPKNPHNGNGSGHALAGNGEDDEDRHPAFPVFSPHPPVKDRSLLPSTEQKIVVDVSLNESGQVVGETLVKGMGNQLDKIVLEIALTWRFQPATVNGKPVPSEAELIFPFNQEYPITEG